MSTHSPYRTADAAAGPELRLLGPFSLSVGGAALHLGSKKARALLAALALGGPLTRAALAELFWGHLGETGARSNVRKTLHALRETPLAAFLDSRGELIACHMDKVDVLEFERLVAAHQLEQAYQIGSGFLLDGLEIESPPWQDWLAARRARHGALLRGVQLNLAASQEALGDVRGALTLVSAVLEHDPFDEQVLGEAMRLHLTLDEHRQAAALYERFRNLIAALDLVPSAAVGALAVRAYRGLPAQVASLPAATVLRAPLVGREAPWLALHHSATALTVLVGEPGVGKTRLATQFAGAHGAGLILRGREEAQHTPFYPVAQLIREALDSRLWSPDELADVWRLEVARLVPECAPGTVLTPAAGDGRTRFLEGLTRAVAGILNGQLLVLDDLHWFDEGTLELVSHLVRRLGGGGPRLIATARLLELEAAPAPRRMLEGLRRDGLSEVLPLGPLEEPDVLALVQGLSGAGGGLLFARRLHAASRGNPLYLLELLRGLMETGTLAPAPEGGWVTPFDESTHDYAELPISSSLRETVLERVARLGAATRRLLEGAALAGEQFESAWLAGLEPDELARLDALEQACRAELLEPAPDGFRFRHEVLRRVLDESLGSERRRVTHHALARQLEAGRATPERIAFHFERAGRSENALPHLERAADAAARVYAYREALAFTERMLEHEQGNTQRWALERRRLWFLSLITDAHSYEGQLDRLKRIAELSGDPNRRAEVYFMRGLFHLFRGQAAEIAAQAESMLALPHLSAESRVNALYVDGHAQTSLGRCVQATRRFSEALELRRTAEGTETSVSAENIENGLTRAYLTCGEFGQAAHHNAQVLGRLEGTNALALIYALNWQAYLKTLQGQFEAALENFAQAAERASQRKDLSALTWVLRHRTSLFLAVGHPRAALQDIHEVRRLSAGQYLRVEAILTGLSAEAYRLQGALGEAFTASEAAITALESLGVSSSDPALAEARLMRARLLSECGDLTASQAELEAVCALDEASDGLSLRLYQGARDTAAARNEIASGQVQRALTRLQTTAHLQNAPFLDRVAHAAELARATAMTGDPQAAPALLTLLLPPPPLQPRVLKVQLEASQAVGDVASDLLTHARRMTALEQAAPTDRLDLMVALVQALEKTGHDASAERALAQITLTSLIASLEGHPTWQAGLLQRFSRELDRQD